MFIHLKLDLLFQYNKLPRPIRKHSPESSPQQATTHKWSCRPNRMHGVAKHGIQFSRDALGPLPYGERHNSGYRDLISV